VRLSLDLSLKSFGASGAGPVTPTYAAESRPATIALARNLTTAGDSTEVGVGTSISPTDYSWPGRLATLLSSGTILRKEVAGMAFVVPGGAANTSPITTQITGQGAGPLGTNDQYFGTALNDYNTGVNPEPGAQAWVEDVSGTRIPTITAAFTGGASQSWAYLSGFAEGTSGPGMVHWASWRYLHKTLQTTYGAHIYDVRRAIQARVTTSASDLDHINVFKWWDLPLSYRGTNGFTFTNNAQTTWLTCSTATISPQASAEAAVEGQVTAVGKADGTLIQNINAAAVLGNNLFVVMNNAWHQLDLKHCGQYGYTAWAREVFDIEAAAQGSGAPCPGPAELFCAQDAGAGAAVGTIYYAGSAAPASVALFDSSQNLVTTLTLTDNGVTNKVGSITVTRSGTGSLTEGEQLLLVQTTDLAGHVLHKPVDFRVGQPSTQTVPRLWTIPGSATLPDSDFTMVGKDAHGLVDANKYWIAGWVNPSVISGNQYIIALGAGHGHLTDLLVRVTSTGTLGIVTHDDANTLLTNISIASVFAAGQPTWFFIDLDYSVSQPTAKGYFNKNGAGSTVVNATGVAATGGGTLNMSRVIPRFFALRDASIANENFVAQDSVRAQFHGKFGNIIVGNGNVGIAGNTSLRAALYQENGNPAARAPYSTLGGLTPVFDVQGGIGDFLNGGFNQSEPVYGTYRGIIGLT
jgi:hypothetical protein